MSEATSFNKQTKNLRKYQQKSNLGAKKKIKYGSNFEIPTARDCHSPEHIQDILKFSVSDLNHTYEAALHPLHNWTAPKDHATPAPPSADETRTSTTENLQHLSQQHGSASTLYTNR
jgi:hypothetical protein